MHRNEIKGMSNKKKDVHKNKWISSRRKKEK